MNRILIPLPGHGFDPTESAIPWRILKQNRIQVDFATPHGCMAKTDPITLCGSGLGVLAEFLKAREDAVEAYNIMEADIAFRSPLKYSAIEPAIYDGILLPGGHAKGMREYLESKVLQRIIVEFFRMGKTVGAICHGVLLAARSIDPETGHSVLYDYRTTALLRYQEILVHHLTYPSLGNHYRTYPDRSVESEVKSALKNRSDFVKGPISIRKDAPEKLSRGFSLRDRNYLSARWPGDIYRFSAAFIKMIAERESDQLDKALYET